LVKPKFLPEGVSPASGYLMKSMRQIFADFSDWTVVIHDNLLVLAHDYADAYAKCVRILERCREYNVILKMAKSYLGFSEAQYFGYRVSHDKIELTNDRIAAIQEVVFPKNKKQMQSFLGSAIFFSSFIPHFASLSAPLYEMTHNNFVWNPAKWSTKYHNAFDAMKAAIAACVANYHPTDNDKYQLRADASPFGVGIVLLAIPSNATDDSDFNPKPIAFASQQFSEQARRWSTIEQEAYALYFA
jgi:hypothetical protein